MNHYIYVHFAHIKIVNNVNQTVYQKFIKQRYSLKRMFILEEKYAILSGKDFVMQDISSLSSVSIKNLFFLKIIFFFNFLKMKSSYGVVHMLCNTKNGHFSYSYLTVIEFVMKLKIFCWKQNKS